MHLARQFEDLHDRLIRGFTGEDQPMFLQSFDVLRIHLIAVAEAQANGLGIAA